MVGPDVVAGEGDVLPAEGGDVREEVVRNGDALCPEVLDGTIDVDGIPVDDRGGNGDCSRYT